MNNNRGQMAIFIALFFQVLFVFFAMAINVGLVVHDKINLQNAVDIAAYYGAARQAEILNQIAHVNYQMRQNYKLFTWRFHALGSIGLDIHPLNPRGGGAANFPASYCVAHDLWLEYRNLDPNSSICRTSTINLPNIPQIQGVTGIVPGANQLVSFVDQTRNQFSRQCNEAGVFNFHFAARMLAHFRVDGAARKRMIFELAGLLNSSTDDFNDLRGDSVLEGVRKTFQRNLTVSNLEGQTDFQFFNSMGAAPCNQQQVWLPELRINPVIRYTDLNGNDIDAGCTGTGQPNRGADSLPAGATQFPLDPVLQAHWLAEPPNDLHSSLGFEKNPWCMAYAGVSATTTVTKLFSPLGGPVTLVARGFAKPFGGRVGPWYGINWPPGNNTSVNAPKTDPFIPSREGGAPGDGNVDIVNYSRYPGDPSGFVVPGSAGVTNGAAVAVMGGRAAAIVGGGANAVFQWQQYDHLGHLATLEQTGDGLSRDGNQLPAVQAELEQAALAPDAFDITYYSIEPRYYELYYGGNSTNGNPGLTEALRIYDWGSSKDGNNNRQIEENVMAQITEAQAVYQGEAQQFIVNDWHHLLTGWHQAGAVDYSFDQEKFGICASEIPNPDFPTTGNCIVGGRTGYSVKSVSRDFLLSAENELGGPGAGASQVLNPPPF